MTDDELKRLLQAFDERRAADVAATRRHFDVTAESVRHDVRLLAAAADHLQKGVADQASQAGMERGFAETQAMIGFSDAELERRVKQLEDGRADLQSRVGRLESTTH